jgi:SAM-dependent methyltransferase
MTGDPSIPNRVYPAMSHPVADPAAFVVAARFAGFEPPDPARARVLEIGCATGHHLLPLAMRWPQAEFTGIDANPDAVQCARALANEAGLSDRMDFHASALEDFDAQGKTWDIIIAHGFFSWVPDEVKRDLLAFCARHLATNGLAVVSFNVEAGWRARMQVVRKVRAIQQAGQDMDAIASLQLLRSATQEIDETTIIDDMLAKGPSILPFDDFAPVNDPWRLDTFAAEADAAGLRWLGESNVADNRPPGWSADDEVAASEVRGRLAPVDFHHWMDERARRTFRSALLCRGDAPVTGKMSISAVFDLALRPASPEPPTGSELARRIHAALMEHWPSAPVAKLLTGRLTDVPAPELAREICREIIHGRLWARCESLTIPQRIPDRPALDPLRLACARRRLPVVDAWHRPCLFPDEQRPVLELIDGSLGLTELKSQATRIAPHLDFDRWIAHLHERGMFVGDLENLER